ncbi:hypothetical protein Tco_1043123 [Tanacetum coccineum]|uniref:Uncharacterized protein n=1 Tax=Tanacetum coccineum TaxID=301880 RepID=A0ABQ5GLJ2_9ASTR
MAHCMYKRRTTTCSHTLTGKRLRGLHRYPQLFGPFSIKVSDTDGTLTLLEAPFISSMEISGATKRPLCTSKS